MDPNQIYRQHQTEKRQYTSQILEVGQATFTPLVFNATGEMVVECTVPLKSKLPPSRGTQFASRETSLVSRDERQESRLARNETRGGNLLLSGTVSNTIVGLPS